MKKSLFILAVLGAFASVAHAQTVDNSGSTDSSSSVTLYGIIDAGVDAVFKATNRDGTSGNQYQFSDGIMQGSRFGLKGQEVLGGGTSAIFQLENGFNVMRGTLGQGGRMFGRQAYVGLTNTQYGTVTLGRQYDNAVDLVGPMNFADKIGGSYAAHLTDIDNLNNSYRFNNAIKYQTPSWNGLQGGAMYSLGGWAGNFSRDQSYSAGVGYTRGPLQVAVAYLAARNPYESLYGYNSNVYSPTAQGMGPGSTDIGYRNYGSANKYQVISAGGTYQFGPAQVGLVYSNTQFRGMSPTILDPNGCGCGAYGTDGSGTAKYNNFELNTVYQVTPQLALGGAFNYTRAKNVFGNGAKANYYQGALAADYSLSKRTDVYTQGVYQRAGKGGFAQINSLSPSTTKNQGVIRIGLRHKF